MIKFSFWACGTTMPTEKSMVNGLFLQELTIDFSVGIVVPHAQKENLIIFCLHRIKTHYFSGGGVAIYGKRNV
jgi:hypothetical protein